MIWQKRLCSGLMLLLSLAPLAPCAARAEGAVPATAAPPVTTPTALRAALAAAQGGETIRLAPGEYGVLRLGTGQAPAGHFARAVTLASADPAHPARFSGLDLRGVENLTLSHLAFAHRFAAGDPAWKTAFSVTGGSGLTLQGSRFTGDLARGTGGPGDNHATGTGLMLRDTIGTVVERSVFRRLLTGITVQGGTRIALRDNEISGMRADGIDLVGVQDVTVARNRIHDFDGAPGAGDHRDMIQMWSRGASRASTGVTIRDNTLDIGTGSWTQGIFLRNEAAEGGAGPAMRYRNVTIEGNVLYDAHVNGIYLGAVDGLRILHNTLLALPDLTATAERKGPDLTVPAIRVAAEARQVTLLGNAVAAIHGPAGQADWTVKDNVMLPPARYADAFLASTMGRVGGRHAFLARPDGPLGRTGAGAPSLQPPAQSDRAEARFQILHDPAQPREMRFDASPSTGIGDGMSFLWQFGDGGTAPGPAVRHAYAGPGRYHVTLTISAEGEEPARAAADLVVQ